jgi:hypothetical protein
VQQLYETRLHLAADAQPAGYEKGKAASTGRRTQTRLRLRRATCRFKSKACSMDGSSVHVEVARDATSNNDQRREG